MRHRFDVEGSTQMNVFPGSPYALGATWDGTGVNFAIYSEHAESVELCLFEEDGRETDRKSVV